MKPLQCMSTAPVGVFSRSVYMCWQAMHTITKKREKEKSNCAVSTTVPH